MSKHTILRRAEYHYYNWRSLWGNDGWEKTTDGFLKRKFKQGISILTPIAIKHYFIYAGNDEVIHFTGNDGDDADIRKETLSSILKTTGVGLFKGKDKKHWIFKLQVVKDATLDKEQMYDDCLKRAERLLQANLRYHPIYSNCEHFAKFCLFGKRAGILHNQAAEKILEQLKKFGVAGCSAFPVLERGVRMLIPAMTVVCGPFIDIFIAMLELASRLFSFFLQLFRLGKFPSFKQLWEILKNVFRFNIIGTIFALVVIAVAIAIIAIPASTTLIVAGIVVGILWVAFRFLKPYCQRLVHWLEDRVLGSPSLAKIAAWNPYHLMQYIIQKAEAAGEQIAEAVSETLARMQLSVQEHIFKRKPPDFPSETPDNARNFVNQILDDLGAVVNDAQM